MELSPKADGGLFGSMSMAFQKSSWGETRIGSVCVRGATTQQQSAWGKIVRSANALTVPVNPRNVNVNEAIKKVQQSLTPDLLVGRWKTQTHPLEGHCYVAAEALWYLLGRTKWKPVCASYIDDGGKATHWWLVHRKTGEIADPTKEQYHPEVPPYHLGKGSGFLTVKPSKRAQVVINRARSL
jgi:hypothetical protein